MADPLGKVFDQPRVGADVVFDRSKAADTLLDMFEDERTQSTKRRKNFAKELGAFDKGWWKHKPYFQEARGQLVDLFSQTEDSRLSDDERLRAKNKAEELFGKVISEAALSAKYGTQIEKLLEDLSDPDKADLYSDEDKQFIKDAYAADFSGAQGMMDRLMQMQRQRELDLTSLLKGVNPTMTEEASQVYDEESRTTQKTYSTTLDEEKTRQTVDAYYKSNDQIKKTAQALAKKDLGEDATQDEIDELAKQKIYDIITPKKGEKSGSIQSKPMKAPKGEAKQRTFDEMKESLESNYVMTLPDPDPKDTDPGEPNEGKISNVNHHFAWRMAIPADQQKEMSIQLGPGVYINNKKQDEGQGTRQSGTIEFTASDIVVGMLDDSGVIRMSDPKAKKFGTKGGPKFEALVVGNSKGKKGGPGAVVIMRLKDLMSEMKKRGIQTDWAYEAADQANKLYPSARDKVRGAKNVDFSEINVPDNITLD